VAGENSLHLNAANSGLLHVPRHAMLDTLDAAQIRKAVIGFSGNKFDSCQSCGANCSFSSRRKCHHGNVLRVSADHFAHELRTQLRSATEQGATRIVITSTELSRSVRLDGSSMDACCQARLDELKDSDVVLRDKGSDAGMIVRYLLPRSG
jgi:tRNA A37 threonylcarbamoyladenosine dehydratase